MTGCLFLNWLGRFLNRFFCNHFDRLLRDCFFWCRLSCLFRGCFWGGFFWRRLLGIRFFHWLASFFWCRLFFGSHTVKLFLKQSLLVEYHSLQFLFHYYYLLKIPAYLPEFRRKYSL